MSFAPHGRSHRPLLLLLLLLMLLLQGRGAPSVDRICVHAVTRYVFGRRILSVLDVVKLVKREPSLLSHSMHIHAKFPGCSGRYSAYR